MEKGDVNGGAWARRDAIDAIYKLLTKRRDTADTTDIMVRLQQIIDEHIDVRVADDKGNVRRMSVCTRCIKNGKVKKV